MSPSDYFAASYMEARAKFCDAAGAAGLAVESFECPAPGPAGERLITDLVRAGPAAAEGLFLVTSATHGVEGFCGSGAQVGLLRRGLLGCLPDGVAVVLVHALNPYGFAHLRRVTEDNVDLNRNFVDHAAPYPDNPDYAGLHDALVPADWDGPGRAAAEAAITAYMAARGPDALRVAVTRGQYSHPDGVFYGGARPTWSNRTWRTILARQTAACRRVALMDIHSGLGPRGYGEIQYEGPPTDAAYLRAQSWYDGEVTSPDDGSSSSAAVTGYMMSAVDDAVPAAERTALGLEFGTLPVDDVLTAVRADNWLYLRGDVGSALGREIKATIRDAFYGDDDGWKRDVWERAADVFRRTLAGLSRG